MKIVFTAIIVIAILWQASSLDWIKMSIDGPEKVADEVNMIFTPNLKEAVFFPLKDLSFLFTHPLFDVSRPTVMYFHGWMESGKLDLSGIAIRGAYDDRGDHNVVTVDWSYYSKNNNYRTILIPQMKVIAETFAEKLRDFLNGGYDIKKLHLVGHSLGGQMVGKIGRQLKKISSGRLVIPRIFALDPTGPGFEDYNYHDFEPIMKTDGKYVQIIHTCGGQLGMLHRVGSADFFPNGGSNHPGCDVDTTASLIGPNASICDHARSWHFYQASVRDPQAFPAIRCSSWDDFVSNETCFKDDIANMGFGANTSAIGKYYLQTNGNQFNLSRGIEGIQFMGINITRLAVPGGPRDQPIPSEVDEMIIF